MTSLQHTIAAVRTQFSNRLSELDAIEAKLHSRLAANPKALQQAQRLARLRVRLKNIEERAQNTQKNADQLIGSIEQRILLNDAAMMKLEQRVGAPYPQPSNEKSPKPSPLLEAFQQLPEDQQCQFKLTELTNLMDHIVRELKGKRAGTVLTLPDLAAKAGSKVAGRSGKRMLYFLRSSNLIEMNHEGVRLVRKDA